MTVKQAYEKAMKIFKAVNIEAPAVEAGVILCHVIKKDRAFLYTHSEYILSLDEEAKFIELINERANGAPVQYLTGIQEFMSLDFKVSPSVLIPRPDTEILVETVIKYIRYSGKANPRILDIGTGSGCIAVSLAYYIEGAEVTAVDISSESLEIARENSKNAGVGSRISFIQSNLFENLNGHGCFDIIVSNPPYIPAADIAGLQVEVRCHEPLRALDGGRDGLSFYRAIIKESLKFLKHGGLLAFEVGYDQASSVAALMGQSYKSIDIAKDLAGIERVVMGKL